MSFPRRLEYNIDPATGRRMMQNSLNTGTSGQSDFGYDNIGQVTSATYHTSPWAKTSDAYEYDASGNRSATNAAPSPGAKVWTPNAMDQITDIGGSTSTHDTNGNMTTAVIPSTASGSMTWDSENRLLSLTGSTTRSLHRYDPFHRLVVTEAQTLAGGVWSTQTRTRNVLDQFNLIEEVTYPGASGTTASETFRYTWGRDLGGSLYAAGGVGGLLLMEKVTAGAPEPWWYHHDANGNVIALTDATGTVAKTARYDAFGNMATWTAPAFASPALSLHHNRHWFSTKPLSTDPSGGLTLHYYGYRWYSPQLGRWPSRDPIGERGGMLLFGMVGNNSVNRVDYLGLFWPPGSNPYPGIHPGMVARCPCIGGSPKEKDDGDETCCPEEMVNVTYHNWYELTGSGHTWVSWPSKGKTFTSSFSAGSAGISGQGPGTFWPSDSPYDAFPAPEEEETGTNYVITSTYKACPASISKLEAKHKNDAKTPPIYDYLPSGDEQNCTTQADCILRAGGFDPPGFDSLSRVRWP